MNRSKDCPIRCSLVVRIAGITLASACLWTTPVVAHVFQFTDVLVVLKSNKTYQIDMTVDVDALALGVSSSTDSKEVVTALKALTPDEFARAVDQAKEIVQRRVRVRFDGEKVDPVVTFPDFGTAMVNSAGIPTVLGTTVRLEGRVPEGASAFTFGASRAFAAVNQTIFNQSRQTSAHHALGPGEENPPFPLDETTTAEASVPRTRYLVLGFEHIMPEGLDHVLFVMGLFLLSTRWRPLLWQITAFTVAHSVTLGLAMHGVVSMPSRVVESLIALSIAYVAIENLFTADLKPWRPAVVFCFGLLHGLGFASALRALGLPREDFATALVLFNVGVELGQLGVVALAFLAVGWFRKRAWYRSVIVLPVSGSIALVGLYWAVQRTWGM